MGQCTSKSIKLSYTVQGSQTASSDAEDFVLEIERATIVKKTLTLGDRLFILSALTKHHLFCSLSKNDMELIYQSLKLYTVPSEETVFEQGSEGRNFYIINSGRIEVFKNSITKNILNKGDTFGEMALLTCAPRRATLKTIENCELWGIGRSVFRKALEVIHAKNYKINKEFISNLPMFSEFSEEEKDQLTVAAVQHDYPDKTRIICEGDEDLLLFIIKEGDAVAKVQGVDKYRIFEGEMFGEEIILSPNVKRPISVFAAGKVQCLSIDKESIIKILGENCKEAIYKSQSKQSMKADKTLSLLPKDDISQIVDIMEWVPLHPGSIACKRFSKKSRIYTLCMGTLRCGGITFNSNQAFGLGNNNQKLLKEDLIAETEGIIGCAKKREIEKICKISCGVMRRKLKIMRFLQKVSIFSTIDHTKLKYLATYAKIVEYDIKEVIFKAGDRADCIFLIRQGSVELFYEGKLIRVLGKHEIFGESCIEEGTRGSTARAIGSCSCFTLPREEYQQILEEQSLPYLQNRPSILSLFQLNQVVKLFRIMKKDYMSIYAASLGEPKPIFQVTIINKYLINTPEACMQLVQEKGIAVCSEHNLTLNYVKTFTDPNFVYIFSNYAKYVPFNSVPWPKKNEEYAKFVASCIVLLIEYLHGKSIAYRDFQPDNLQIKENGYIMLNNFSKAKKIGGRTYTRISNPLYSAPEMFDEHGYHKTVDFWSLGVIVYEMIYGCYPFSVNKTDDPLTIYKKIQENPLEFPEGSAYFKANDFIKMVLEKNPKERTVIKELKFSKWLSYVDWMRIGLEEYEPPFKPVILETNHKRRKKTDDLISLQRYANEKLFNSKGRPLVKFNWDRYF